MENCKKRNMKELKELLTHGNPDFPCAGYAPGGAENEEVFLWHWHEELELFWVREGQLHVKTPSASFLLKKGDCMAINSNILHYGIAEGGCKLRSMVFSSELITGGHQSAFARKYIHPLLSCPAFSAYLIPASCRDTINQWFHLAFEAIKHKPLGYEFTVREYLSRICLFLYTQFEMEIAASSMVPSRDHLRIRTMLEYIHTHFSQHITLEDIAGAAGIGERECLRCFKKTIQLSPVQYLLKYRILNGAKMLLENPGSSIAEIAACCGFDSPSNFTRTFKNFYHCSPKEYRSFRWDGDEGL